jgi:antitoxin CptB
MSIPIQSRLVSPARLFSVGSKAKMNREDRLKRLGFRAWHRGTKEADLLIGGYFDKHSPRWDDPAILWFEALLQEEDVEIMAWAIGTAVPPERYQGPMMRALQTLDYIKHPE